MVSPFSSPESGRQELQCLHSKPTDGYPYPWAFQDFEDLLHLCDYPHVGCVCHPDGTMTCEDQYGIFGLWAAFNPYCHQFCQCVGPNTASSSGTKPVDTTIDMSQAEICPIWDSDDETPGCSAAQAAGTSETISTVTHDCTGRCLSVARSCAWGYLGECICTAPKIGVLFLASGACAKVVNRLVPGNGKRGNVGSHSTANMGLNSTLSAAPNATSGNVVFNTTQGLINGTSGELVACICNSTYISYGCCGSQTGIIWEPQELNLFTEP